MANFKKQLTEWSKAANAADAIHIVETDVDYIVPILYLRLIHQFAEAAPRKIPKGDIVVAEELFPSELANGLNETGVDTVNACIHYLMRNGALSIGHPLRVGGNTLVYVVI